jgi:hypothetical protein
MEKDSDYTEALSTYNRYITINKPLNPTLWSITGLNRQHQNIKCLRAGKAKPKQNFIPEKWNEMIFILEQNGYNFQPEPIVQKRPKKPLKKLTILNTDPKMAKPPAEGTTLTDTPLSATAEESEAWKQGMLDAREIFYKIILRSKKPKAQKLRAFNDLQNEPIFNSLEQK